MALRPYNNVFYGTVGRIIENCVNSKQFLKDLASHYAWLSKIPKKTQKKVIKLLDFNLDKGTHKAFMV